MSGQTMRGGSPNSPATGETLVHPVKYRADIDGLRAISVIAVILFHLSPGHFKAGGIGVDIFFVISGFLIGGIILASLDSGRFSYAEFYLRRIRRIIPAFLAMLIVTTILSLIFFFPQELVRMALSALFAFLCSSNIYFYATSDYFAPNAAFLPLLHTWTLAVEEQFYFTLPLIAGLIYARGWQRHLLAIFGVGLVFSLAISQIEVNQHSPAAFYLLPSRAWELMLGVLAARIRPGVLVARVPRELAAAVGLVLILASLVMLDPARGFPGWRGLPPCLGAALLLTAGQAGPTATGRLLSIWPARITGLASYSLYLWHWPIIVFLMRTRMIGKLPVSGIAEAFILSLIIGFLSWRFIETPFRDRRVTPQRLLTGCGVMSATLLAMLAAIFVTGGLPQRIPPRAVQLAAYENNVAGFDVPKSHCFLHDTDTFAFFDQQHCLENVAGKPNWLLVGDSHAAMLYGGIRDSFPAINLQTAIVYGCDVRIRADAGGSTCNDLMNFIFQRYLPSARIKGVILTSRWEVLDPDALAWLAHMLAQRGIKLVLVGPAPEYSLPVARILAESVWHGDPALPNRLLDPKLWSIDSRLRALAPKLGYFYLSPMRAMCDGAVHCLLSDKSGRPLYSDGTHYHNHGARVLIARLREIDAREGRPLASTLALPHP